MNKTTTVPLEITEAMMDAGQAYLNAQTLSLNPCFNLPATFRWNEFWSAILTASPNQTQITNDK